MRVTEFRSNTPWIAILISVAQAYLLLASGTVLGVQVGPNTPVAGRIDAYQGAPSLSADPANPSRMLAAATSGEHGSTQISCNPAAPSGMAVGATAKLYSTYNAGFSWINRCAPWVPLPSKGVSNADFYFQTSPAVAYGTNGSAIAVYVQGASETATGNTGTALVAARSTDDGNTWIPAGVLDGTMQQSGHVWSDVRLAVDNSTAPTAHQGRMYVAAILGTTMPPYSSPYWAGYDQNSVVLVSDNHVNGSLTIFAGDTYNQWKSYTFNSNTVVFAAPSLTIGQDGTVYVVWNTVDPTGFCSMPDVTVFSKSSDGGVTWSSPTVLRKHSYCSIAAGSPVIPDPPAQFFRRANAFASIDIDRNPKSAYYDRLYVTYADWPPDQTSTLDLDIFLQSSSDSGLTWTKPMRVNDDEQYDQLGNRVGNTQMIPALAVDQSDGSVNFAWYDSRNFPKYKEISGGTHDGVAVYTFTRDPRTQVFYARSSDGGASVEQNIQITDGGQGTPFVSFVHPGDSLDEFTMHWGPKLLGDDDLLGHLFQYGDHMGLIAGNRQARAVWTDTRDAPEYAEDVGTAVVTSCSAPVWNSALTATVASGTVNLSWPAVSSWGTDGGNGDYIVWRVDAKFADVAPPFSSYKKIGKTPQTSYSDSSAAKGYHCYIVQAANSCKGTPLTPMYINSAPQCVVTP